MEPTARPIDLSFLNDSSSLPSLPAVAIQVIKMTQDPDTDLSDIAATVAKDPGFAARLVKLSNSPLFGRAREVTNLSQAVMTLGLKAVKMAAISLSLGSALGKPNDENRALFRAYWRRAVTAAAAARQVARDAKKTWSEEALLCGLLMDVGFPTLVWTRHPPYQPVLGTAATGHPDPIAEAAAIGATHADVAAFILEKWGVSPVLIQTVRHHHAPDAMGTENPTEVLEITRALNFAHDVATVLSGDTTRAGALAEVKRKGAEWFGLKNNEIDLFMANLASVIVEMARVIDVDVGTTDELAILLTKAQDELLQMTLGTTVELQNTKIEVQRLERKATTDPLTGVKNRAAFDEIMEKQWRQESKGAEGETLGVIMVDVDHFKKVNDVYGHQSGDAVLKAVASTLEASCRKVDRASDTVCRYGGEEFVVVMANIGFGDFGLAAERLRKAVEALEVTTPEGVLKVTASFGACMLRPFRTNVQPDELVKLADQNLYRAKESGRNRTIISLYGGDSRV